MWVDLLQEKSFPLKLAPTLLNKVQQCLFDNQTTEVDRDYLTTWAIQKRYFEECSQELFSVDSEELIDVFSNYRVKWVPKKENCKTDVWYCISGVVTEALFWD